MTSYEFIGCHICLWNKPANNPWRMTECPRKQWMLGRNLMSMFIWSCWSKTPAVVRILSIDFSAQALPPWSKTFAFSITTLKPIRCHVLCRSDWTARADGSWSHMKQIFPWPRYCSYFTISRTACFESFFPLNGMQPTEPLWESCKTNVVSFALSSSSWSSPKLFPVKAKSKLNTGISLSRTRVSSLSCLSGFPLLLTHASHHAA